MLEGESTDELDVCWGDDWYDGDGIDDNKSCQYSNNVYVKLDF